MNKNSLRVGGTLGIMHVVVLLAGFALYIEYADPTKTLTERYVDSSQFVVYTGGYIEVVGYLLFLPFAAFMYRMLRSAETESAFGATTAFAAAVVYVATTLTPGLAAFGAATAGGHRGILDTSALASLDQLRLFSYYVSLLALACFLAAVAVSSLTSRILPGWLSVAAAVAGTVLAIGVAGAGSGWQEIPALLSLVWVLAVSGWALRTAGRLAGDSTGQKPNRNQARLARSGAPSRP